MGIVYLPVTQMCLNCAQYVLVDVDVVQERPYQHDSTASRLLSEVKHVRAQLVLRWGTTLESWVLFFLTQMCLNCAQYVLVDVFALQERPYQHDSTASRLLSEVKHVRAQLVLRWGTTLESWVLFFLFCRFTFLSVDGT
jgi:exo-beta-1,3-glucanase (GH17 family)